MSIQPNLHPDGICDGGDLDCGSGLLLIIREAMQPLPPGGILEIRSREISVKEDLPAWCRLVGHRLRAIEPGESGSTSYFVQKQKNDEALLTDLEKAKAFTWSVRVRWTSGMQAKALVRNHSFLVGQPASFDTSDAAPNALEYVLSALGGCLAVGLQWRASRRGIEIRNLELVLKARPENILVFLGLEDEGNPGLATIEGTLYIDAEVDDGVIEELWQETLARSPLTQTLTRPARVQVEIKRT
ncbi:MAG: osmotically inducible protein OsmC [Acidobacteria bacterium]|nr:MAG: osmotically inducible protein OsmC [Acidobacteriota bacterium]